MSDAVIRVEGIGKRYRVGQRQSYRALRDVLAGAFRRNGKRKPTDFIWAVRDVSFEVKQGEVVGLIGRNGAGKSTLLKLLARITRPTVGHAELHGRIGSLLEVGTGFHPELTGRENIFLSGAILGMSKAEIRRKYDEIVAFSEVERFIDTPLKHYSSGMGMRLAFAVAAHLEPEILLVDEVLSVGDFEFQKKCLGKMGDVARQGRTILFVSHNLNAVSSLCRSVMLLADGKLSYHSENIQEGIRLYSNPTTSTHTVNLCGHPNRTPRATAVFEEIAVQDENGGLSRCLPPGANVVIRLKLRSSSRISNPKIGIAATNYRGERIFAVGTYIGGNGISTIQGTSTINVRFVLPPLVPGEYALDIGLYSSTGNMIDEVFGAVSLEVLKDDYISMVDRHSPEMGHIMVRSEWTCAQEADANSDELKAEML